MFVVLLVGGVLAYVFKAQVIFIINFYIVKNEINVGTHYIIWEFEFSRTFSLQILLVKKCGKFLSRNSQNVIKGGKFKSKLHECQKVREIQILWIL